MELQDAKILTKSLMKEHGILDFQVVYFRNNLRVGRCDLGKKKIMLNKNLIKYYDKKTIVDTILHEISHVLVPNGLHDKLWKDTFIKIGGSGDIEFTDRKKIF